MPKLRGFGIKIILSKKTIESGLKSLFYFSQTVYMPDYQCF